MGDVKTDEHGLAIGNEAHIRGSKGLVDTSHLNVDFQADICPILHVGISQLLDLHVHVHVSQTAAYVAHMLNCVVDLGMFGEQNT